MNDIVLSIDPFLARKIEVVATERNLSFADALLFLLQAVITPFGDTPQPV